MSQGMRLIFPVVIYLFIYLFSYLFIVQLETSGSLERNMNQCPFYLICEYKPVIIIVSYSVYE